MTAAQICPLTILDSTCYHPQMIRNLLYSEGHNDLFVPVSAVEAFCCCATSHFTAYKKKRERIHLRWLERSGLIQRLSGTEKKIALWCEAIITRLKCCGSVRSVTNRRLRLNSVLSFSYLQLPVHLVKFPVLWLADQTARREKIQRSTGTIRAQMMGLPGRHFSHEALVAVHVQQLNFKKILWSMAIYILFILICMWWTTCASQRLMEIWIGWKINTGQIEFYFQRFLHIFL